MISQIRNSIFIKILWGFMGLYLLNISVDTADLKPEYIPEDLSFNDQESIVEILVEQVLGFENALEEYDDHDTEDYSKKKQGKIDLLVQANTINQNTANQHSSHKVTYPAYEARLINGFKQIDSPPPKV